jgi:hypothetical protein
MPGANFLVAGATGIVPEFLLKKYFPGQTVDTVKSSIYGHPCFSFFPNESLLYWTYPISHRINSSDSYCEEDMFVELTPLKGQERYLNNPYYQIQDKSVIVFIADMGDPEALTKLSWIKDLIVKGQNEGKVWKNVPLHLIALSSDQDKLDKEELNKFIKTGQVHILNRGEFATEVTQWDTLLDEIAKEAMEQSIVKINFSEQKKKLEIYSRFSSDCYDSQKINSNMVKFLRDIPESLRSKPIFRINNVTESYSKLLETVLQRIEPVFISVFEKISKISSGFKDSALTPRKSVILESFKDYCLKNFNDSTTSRFDLVKDWIEEYKVKNGGENPFTVLEKQRRTGILSIFNPKKTASLALFEDFLGSSSNLENLRQDSLVTADTLN